MIRGARFSRDRRYRYVLTRRWSEGPSCAFVLLNPSTADAWRDDPTIRRCIGFARDWGFGALVVVNLFAFRATRPRELRRARDPVGARNDRVLLAETRRAGLVLIGWGAHGTLRGRAGAVRELLAPVAPRLRHLGTTRSGEPRHPLYVRRAERARPVTTLASR